MAGVVPSVIELLLILLLLQGIIENGHNLFLAKKQPLQLLVCFSKALLKIDQFYKEIISSLRSKFFPSRVEHSSQERHKHFRMHCPLQPPTPTSTPPSPPPTLLPSVTRYLKWFDTPETFCPPLYPIIHSKCTPKY